VDHFSRAGLTPLMVAAQASSGSAVRALLEAGAQPDVRNAQDKNWTALMYAVKASSSTVVGDLAGAGAFVNAEDRAGDTPMHMAARVSNASVVRTLLEHGSDVNRHSGIDRKTPLEIAVDENDRDVAAALVEGGACVTDAMREHAEAKKNEKMIAILAEGDRRDCRRP
jgi:ankyrin repeat protein